MASSSHSEARREKQLLLCCARTRLRPDGAVQIRELVSKSLDWPYVFAAAVEHGIAPLLYRQLKSACPDAVPPLWQDQFHEAFQDNGRRNLLLAGELLGILETARQNGVTVIPYKGPVLAEQAYGALELRQFADLDIVVAQRDVPRVHGLLTARGFEAESDVPAASPGSRERIPGQYQFIHSSRQTIVEVHTEATLRYVPKPLDFNALSRRLERVELAGHEVLTFSVEDALPILCVHGSKHFWERLSWIADIAELVQISRGVDWALALQRAKEFGAERMLLLGLHLANDLLGAPLPEAILQSVRHDRVALRLGEEVRAQFFNETRAQPGVLHRALFRMRMRGNLWDGIGYVGRLATAPTEEDWSEVRLAGRLSRFYSALRPFRLLRKYGLGLRQRPETDLAHYVPTPPWVIERMLALAELGPDDVVYDLGCGDGRIVVTAAKLYGARGVGVDIDPRRIAEAKARARAEGVEHLVKFLRQDAKTVELSEATVVTLYLRLLGNARLGERLRTELCPGARIVSRDGGIPGWPTEKTERCRDAAGETANLFLWRIAAEASRGAESEEVGRRAKAAQR